MGSEVFLYAYGLVCLSMLVFNIVYSLHLRSSDRRLRRQVRGIAARAEVQMTGSAKVCRWRCATALTWRAAFPVRPACWPLTTIWMSWTAMALFSRSICIKCGPSCCAWP